jgi:hypothetical protein
VFNLMRTSKMPTQKTMLIAEKISYSLIFFQFQHVKNSWKTENNKNRYITLEAGVYPKKNIDD